MGPVDIEEPEHRLAAEARMLIWNDMASSPTKLVENSKVFPRKGEGTPAHAGLQVTEKPTDPTHSCVRLA